MNQLTNEEIAKVFAMYFPCECRITNGNPNQVLFLQQLGSDFCNVGSHINHIGGYRNNYTAVKLLLKSLSNISDEDAVEVAKFAFTEVVNHYQLIEIGKDYINYIFLGGSLSNRRSQDVDQFDVNHNFQIYQYLISKGYAVPLFFGVNHWANGKTLIELGHAIENK